jgi:hypothetical protein
MRRTASHVAGTPIAATKALAAKPYNDILI